MGFEALLVPVLSILNSLAARFKTQAEKEAAAVHGGYEICHACPSRAVMTTLDRKHYICPKCGRGYRRSGLGHVYVLTSEELELLKKELDGTV